jgi:hypothetical protein
MIAKALQVAQQRHRIAHDELERVTVRQQREKAMMNDTRRRDGLFVTTHVIGYRRLNFPVALEEKIKDESGSEREENVCEEHVLVAHDGILVTQAEKNSDLEKSDSYEEEIIVNSIGTQTEAQSHEFPPIPPLELTSIDGQSEPSVILESGSTEGHSSASVILVDAWTHTTINHDEIRKFTVPL